MCIVASVVDVHKLRDTTASSTNGWCLVASAWVEVTWKKVAHSGSATGYPECFRLVVRFAEVKLTYCEIVRKEKYLPKKFTFLESITTK